MKFSLSLERFLRVLFCAFAMASLFASTSFVDTAHAAPSAEKRKIKKLNKQVRSLRRQIARLRNQVAGLNRELDDALAANRAPVSHFPIEMVTVGDPGNPADGLTGFGAVASEFQISKFEVTNAQYAVFLNAVAATDANGLFDVDMGAQPHGGILQVGSPGSYRYAVKTGMADKPVTFITFWNACRFCNWLHNGRPTGVQDASTTENGAYDLVTDPNAIANNSVTRKAGAAFYLPSENQWYKAAYYQPTVDGGDADGYWQYPTKSNSDPTKATADEIGDIDNDDMNIANYGTGAVWDAGFDGEVDDGSVTTVGSGGLGSASHYGCFDIAGNVWEWNESVINTIRRGIRGGSWKLESGSDSMLATNRNKFLAYSSVSNVGFRVVTD